MPSKFAEQFAAWIQECRVSFNNRTLLERLGLSFGTFKKYISEIEQPRLSHYKILFKKGQIVWGAMAQANQGIFMPGPMDLPGVTIYSPDAYYDEHPEELIAIASACGQLKGYVPADRQFQGAANRMTDEQDATPRLALPAKLTQGRTVYMAATEFHRQRLPNGMLCGNFFPLVIAPNHTELNMLPLLETWPATLCKQYGPLSEKIEPLAAKSPVCQLVQKLEKSPFVNPYRTWDFTVKPVQATPRVKAFLLKLKAEEKLKQIFMVFLQLDEAGEKHPRFVPAIPAGQNEVIESNGIKIIIPKSQREALRGSVIDFVDTQFGYGFVLRDAND